MKCFIILLVGFICIKSLAQSPKFNKQHYQDTSFTRVTSDTLFGQIEYTVDQGTIGGVGMIVNIQQWHCNDLIYDSAYLKKNPSFIRVSGGCTNSSSWPDRRTAPYISYNGKWIRLDSGLKYKFIPNK
jgi:hypothetical protein